MHAFLKHPSLPIQACECGAVANLKGQVLKPRADKDGYLKVDCGPKGSRKTVRVHRIVLATFTYECDLEVDHKDRNRANCDRLNLRYLTRSQNTRNVGVNRRSESGVRNVRWRKDRDKWQAYAHIDGRMKSLGHFDTLAEATTAAEKHYGTP